MTIFTRLQRKAIRRKQHPDPILWRLILIILIAHLLVLAAAITFSLLTTPTP